MIETAGVPSALEASDAMCKAAQVVLIGYENTDLGRITVLIQGAVGEVEVAVKAGLQAVTKVNGGEILSHHIIPRPHQNVLTVLVPRREDLIFPPPLSP